MVASSTDDNGNDVQTDDNGSELTNWDTFCRLVVEIRKVSSYTAKTEAVRRFLDSLCQGRCLLLVVTVNTVLLSEYPICKVLGVFISHTS